MKNKKMWYIIYIHEFFHVKYIFVQQQQYKEVSCNLELRNIQIYEHPCVWETGSGYCHLEK